MRTSAAVCLRDPTRECQLPHQRRAGHGGNPQAYLARAGLYALRRAENKRTAALGALSGWDQLRNRLVGDEDGRPMLYMFDSCAALIRTLPALQHDPDKPEDVDSESEDHAPDECRYAVMSRPFVRGPTEFAKRRPLLAPGPQNEITMDMLFTQAELDDRHGSRYYRRNPRI